MYKCTTCKNDSTDKCDWCGNDCKNYEHIETCGSCVLKGTDSCIQIETNDYDLGCDFYTNEQV